MKIYKDINSGDELFSDTYKVEETDDGFFYRVEGKLTTETTEVDDNMFGGNKSAEGGGDEDASGAISQSGINVVIAHKLVSTTYDKKSYKLHLKDFMKHMLKTLKENDKSEDEIKGWQEAAKLATTKFILPNFDDFEFYIGESMDQNGLTVLVKWETPKDKPEGDEVPALYFMKECVVGEKV